MNWYSLAKQSGVPSNWQDDANKWLGFFCRNLFPRREGGIDFTLSNYENSDITAEASGRPGYFDIGFDIEAKRHTYGVGLYGFSHLPTFGEAMKFPGQKMPWIYGIRVTMWRDPGEDLRGDMGMKEFEYPNSPWPIFQYVFDRIKNDKIDPPSPSGGGDENPTPATSPSDSPSHIHV